LTFVVNHWVEYMFNPMVEQGGKLVLGEKVGPPPLPPRGAGGGGDAVAPSGLR
jgi:hypothetical protein